MSLTGTSPTYHTINYNLRSAKSIERKIILETIRGLYPPNEISKYRYVGFGSIFFADFRLVHKELGINRMVCIEGSDDEQRFQFNKPYKCIELRMGMSNRVLPNLDWSCKNIVWLDYDRTLQPYMFDDLETLTTCLKADSFLILTCNGTLPSFRERVKNENGQTIDRAKIEEFKRLFGDHAPFEIEEKDFSKANVPGLLRKMFANCIESKLQALNGVKLNSQKIKFLQLFNICYKDNADMYTFGGLFLENSKLRTMKAKPEARRSFISTGEDSFNISSPIITNREVDLMNQYLPNGLKRFLKTKQIQFIPEPMRQTYHSFYRYFPHFMEIRDF